MASPEVVHATAFANNFHEQAVAFYQKWKALPNFPRLQKMARDAYVHAEMMTALYVEAGEEFAKKMHKAIEEKAEEAKVAAAVDADVQKEVERGS